MGLDNIGTVRRRAIGKFVATASLELTVDDTLVLTSGIHLVHQAACGRLVLLVTRVKLSHGVIEGLIIFHERVRFLCNMSATEESLELGCNFCRSFFEFLISEAMVGWKLACLEFLSNSNLRNVRDLSHPLIRSRLLHTSNQHRSIPAVLPRRRRGHLRSRSKVNVNAVLFYHESGLFDHNIALLLL